MTAALPTLRVAAVQMNSGADKSANIAAALDLIDQAAATGARLVTLPEVWPYLGPSAGERDAAEAFPGPTLELLAERARRTAIYLHAGSMLESRAGEPRLFNTTVVFDPQGEIIARYSKIHMFDVVLDGVGGYEESENVAPGDEIVTVRDRRRPGRAGDLLRPALPGALPHPGPARRRSDHPAGRVHDDDRQGPLGDPDPGPRDRERRLHGRAGPGRLLLRRQVRPLVLRPLPDRRSLGHRAGDRAGRADMSSPARSIVARVRNVRRQVPSLANRMPDRYRWPDAVEAGTVVGR